MIDTQFPQLMECLSWLINTKRYHDAENLLREAREYAAVRPPGQEAADLIAEAAAERWRRKHGELPTRRQLADRLTADKQYPSATQPTVDNALARLEDAHEQG